MPSLSDWLRAKHITDADFARRIGVSRVTVGRYCRGERFPNSPTLLRIQHETGGEVTPDSFLAMWTAAHSPGAPATPVASQGSGKGA